MSVYVFKYNTFHMTWVSLLGGDGTVWVTDMGRASACTYDHTSQCYIWSDTVTKTHVEKDFIAFKSSTPRKWLQKEQFLNQLVSRLQARL